MKQIELPTTQNVILKYELPDLLIRIVAFIIDIIILVIYMFLMGYVISSLGADGSVALVILLYLPAIFYTLISELLMNGQTIGKKLLGIRRISVSGKSPEISDYVLAWSMRLVEVFGCMGSLAAIFILGSDRNQRLGDKLSNTIIIKTMKSNKSLLDEIFRIKTNATEAVYPQIIRYNEEQLLFMKNVVVRNQKYPNKKNAGILAELANKVVEELSIEVVPQNKSKFITQLIKDYVVLTR